MWPGWSSVEAGPRHHPLGPELLAAPGADDQIRLLRDHLIDRHHAISGGASACTIGKDVDAAGDGDELRDPPNRRNQRVVYSLNNTLGRFGNRSAQLRASAKRVSTDIPRIPGSARP
jgi:hypothetical protein